MSKLVKPLEAELAFNKEAMTEDPELTLTSVQNKFSKMMQEQEWTLECPEGSTIVNLRTKRGDMDVLVTFDAELVAESINSAYEENEEFEEEEESRNEYEEDELTEDEMDEFEGQPFNFNVELRRPALPGKYLDLTLEAIPGSNGSTDAVYLDSLAIRTDGASDQVQYNGPRLGDLEEGLREAMEKWAENNLRHLVPVIAELSRAKENHEYDQWLRDLKAFAKQ
jgi:hypothetical protein